ncbi:MAG: hypothetical protein WC620_01200 [Methanoregula sp.]
MYWRATLVLAEIGEPAIQPLIATRKEKNSDLQWTMRTGTLHKR